MKATRRERWLYLERENKVRRLNINAAAHLKELRKEFKMKKPFITVTHGISGWFAIMLGWIPDLEDWEPIERGFGRYPTKEEAIVEAKAWAISEEVEFDAAPKHRFVQ